MRNTALGLVVLCLSAAPAAGQDRRVTIDFGAGGTVALAKASDVFDNGLHLDFGTTMKLSEQLAFRADYFYSAHGGSPDVPVIVPAGTTLVINVNHGVQYGAANAMVYPKMAGRLRAYGIAGVGLYRRSVELTSAGTGNVSLCHPNLYVCTSGSVPVGEVLGSRSSTDVGFNVGAGVSVRVDENLQLFVEARWHYVASPSAQYLPVTLGVRF